MHLAIVMYMLPVKKSLKEYALQGDLVKMSLLFTLLITYLIVFSSFLP
jgi:hypothetical protein